MRTDRRRFLGAAAAAAAGAAASGCAAAAPAAAPDPGDRLNHDLHTHTAWSDGTHSIALHVLEARAFELDAIAITDHFTHQSRIGKTEEDFDRYLENVVRAYLALCDIPFLNGIAHPFNTGNTTPAALPDDYPRPLLRELAAKMAEKGKVFDVMNDTIYWFEKSGVAPRALTAQYVELVKVFAAAGVTFQVSSDDHRTGLGNTRWSRLVLARAGVPPRQIVDPAKIRRIQGP